MEVYFDQQLIGETASGSSLASLIGGDRLELTVCTRVDGVDDTLDAVLTQNNLTGKRLDLFSFDGWLAESASLVTELVERIGQSSTVIAGMTSQRDPVELLDELMLKPKEILSELEGVAEHLGPELSAAIDELKLLSVAAESVLVAAVRDKDFIRVADALRLEWSIFLRGLVSFLEPEVAFEMPAAEASSGLSPEALYALNLKALEERFPLLCSPLKAAWEERDEERYRFEEGPSGLRAPRINNQRMWSVMTPLADAEHIAAEHRGDAKYAVWDCSVSWGLSGEVAHQILAGEMEGRPQIFVRPDLQAFAAELHCCDWRPLLEADHTVLCTTVSDYRWTLRNCFVHNDRIRRLSSPNLLAVDPELYVELHEQSGHTELSLIMEDFTGISRGRGWVINELENVAVLLDQPDARELKDMRKGMPGLLVAPGPSLKKNLHLIPEFAKKGVVVGVSHVLGKLQDMGVDPELTVAIEGYDISNHFDNSDPTRTSLFLHESTNPNVVNLPVAQRWVVHDGGIGARLRPDENLRSVNMVASSCTHVVMWALKELGCDPIVFVGLDLALEDGRQYADGCEGTTPTQQTLEVDGYFGEKVQTLSQYNVFRDQFELCISHPLFSDRRYINATEGGARIDGTDQMSLAEVIESLAERPDKELHGPLVAEEHQLPSIDWSLAAQAIETSASDLEEAEASARRGLKSAKEAITCFKAGDEAGVSRRGRAASKRARRANEVLTNDHILNGRWMAEQNKRSQRLEREVRYLGDDPKAVMRHNLNHYQQLLASIEEATRSLRPHYEEAAKTIRERHNV